MNYSDSLIVALANISSGSVFLFLLLQRPWRFVFCASISSIVFWQLAHREVLIGTGWHHLQDTSMLVMVAMMIVAAAIHLHGTFRRSGSDA
jgi:hypothetical protein